MTDEELERVARILEYAIKRIEEELNRIELSEPKPIREWMKKIYIN